MSIRYTSLGNISVSNPSAHNTYGKTVYNPDADLFYSLGSIGSPSRLNISYMQVNNNAGTATMTSISSQPTEFTALGSNNSYTMCYYNRRLYVCTYSTIGKIYVLYLDSTYKSISGFTTKERAYGTNESILQVYFNPYSKMMYHMVTILNGSTFSNSPNYRMYNLDTDPSLNNELTNTIPFDTTSTTNTNTQLTSLAFDSNNNVYYTVPDGIYRAPIDSSFNINTPNKTRIVTLSNTYITQLPNTFYNSYNNSLYYNNTNSTTVVQNIYNLDTSQTTTNISPGVYWYIAMDSLNNMFFVPFAVNSSPFTMKVNYRIVCFKEDTQILTQGGYKPIQDLRKGDLVKTSQSGYKPIYKIGHTEINHQCSEERIKDQLYKCSTENFPEVFEDLVITGCHNILVDNFKNEEERKKAKEVNDISGDREECITENKYRLPACVDERTTVYESAGVHKIYHFALENEDYYMNYGVYANGLLVESTSKRFMDEQNMKEN
jgi:hypothetical protein